MKYGAYNKMSNRRRVSEEGHSRDLFKVGGLMSYGTVYGVGFVRPAL